MSADERAQEARPKAARAPGGVPGGWAAVGISIVSALIAGYLVRPAASVADGAGAAGLSRLAEVAPDEVGAALETVEGSREQIAQFRAKESCKRRLAWVTIVGLPNRPAGRIRLQSGRYISPAFEMTDVPVRVALPYPAPYPAGRGTISILGTSSDATVALSPAWQVMAQQGFQSHEVTWTPLGCPAAEPSAE